MMQLSFCQQVIALLAAIICGAPPQQAPQVFAAAPDPPTAVIVQQAQVTEPPQPGAARFEPVRLPPGAIVREVARNQVRDAQVVNRAVTDSAEAVGADVVAVPRRVRAVVAEEGPAALPEAVVEEAQRVTITVLEGGVVIRQAVDRVVDRRVRVATRLPAAVGAATSEVAAGLVRAQGTVRGAVTVASGRIISAATDPNSEDTVQAAVAAAPRTIAAGVAQAGRQVDTGIQSARREIRRAISDPGGEEQASRAPRE